jgi:DNA primase
VEVIKRYVELKRAGSGGSWMGLCPFHSEKTPSFHVNGNQQYFYCFGCHEKGDVFRFIMKLEQRSFMEVLRELAQQAAVDLGERTMTPAERKAREDAESERGRMLKVMEAATAFYETEYAGTGGAAARTYVEGRGLSADMIAQFRIGYAPARGRGDALVKFLATQKMEPEVAERLGLLGTNERGRYDFFRDRVMLPVLDRQKRPVGFSSRLLDPDARERKYVNLPDSPLFHKREQLYGLHVALEPIRKAEQVVVVEGNFDVLALHQAGVREAVAPMGTALTAEQITLLGRLARRVFVVFDGDEAGERAARRVVPLFVELDVDGRIARLPAGVDPDDFVRVQGGEAFRKLLEGAKPMVEKFIDDLSREADTSIPGRVEALTQAAQLLAKVRNQTARELYAGRLAASLGLDVPQVTRAVRAAQNTARRPPAPASAMTGPEAVPDPHPGRSEPPPRHELELVLLLVCRPELAQQPQAEEGLALLRDGSLRELYRGALNAIAAEGRVDKAAWLDNGPADVRETLAAALAIETWSRVEGPERAQKSLIAQLKRVDLDAKLAIVHRQRQDAETQGDESSARELARQEIDLIRQKQQLKDAHIRH